jgi:hypothetical protein
MAKLQLVVIFHIPLPSVQGNKPYRISFYHRSIGDIYKLIFTFCDYFNIILLRLHVGYRFYTFWNTQLFIERTYRGFMITLIKTLLTQRAKGSNKTFETNRLLESAEIKIGGESFELAGGYKAFSVAIVELCHRGTLQPIKSSGTNGMTPAIYAKYRFIEEKENIPLELYQKELMTMHPKLKKDYYLKNLNQYELDRGYILSLNNFLQMHESWNSLEYRCTLNERSFEIFNDEKFLDSRGGAFLKRLGLEVEDLNCYKTYEAFFYIFLKPGTPRNVLIIENKDTFMSLARAMSSEGNEQRNKNNINLLIYGEGNKITNSFRYMRELCCENVIDTIFYYGDIDYPGLDIFQRLAKGFTDYNIVPHTGLYKGLIKSVGRIPKAKNAAVADISCFLSYFDREWSERIATILESRGYIPQEGLTFAKGEFEI